MRFICAHPKGLPPTAEKGDEVAGAVNLPANC